MEKKRIDTITSAAAGESKTIIYLHGFGSSGQSGTVEHLRRILPQCRVLAPDIPICPSEALPFLKDYCEKNHPELIIGTSMGGMYAMQMHDYQRICVNPALRMSELTDILKLGTFKYFQPTQNGKTHFTITENVIQQFREMESHLFDGVNDESRQRCWGFFGDNDTIVNCREEFERHFPSHVQTFQGEHRMNNRVLDQVILPFVEKLLGVFNWGGIPLETLDKGYVRYEPYNLGITYRHPLRSAGGTEHKGNCDEAKRIILSTYPMYDEQIQIVEGSDGMNIALLVSLLENNVEVIEDAMRKLGFLRNKLADENILVDIKGREWVELRFEGEE